MQTFGVLKELMAHHFHTYGLIIGGTNRASEAQKLANGEYGVVSMCSKPELMTQWNCIWKAKTTVDAGWNEIRTHRTPKT